MLSCILNSLQVQSIANLATGIFAELSQLSPTLVAVSKTLVGVSFVTAYKVELLFVPSHTAFGKQHCELECSHWLAKYTMLMLQCDCRIG